MNEIKLFEEAQIRSLWNEKEQQWYFSVVDVVSILTDSADPKQYIKKMRARDEMLSLKWGTICTLVQMKGADGKNRKITAANTDGILRIIQSIPSKKAEPLKLWLAQVGRERLEEIADPGRALERVRSTYRQKGYSDEWIEKRLQSIDSRKQLTDTWKERGIEDNRDYAILTAEISKAAFGMTPSEYKKFKGIDEPLVNVRDHMTDIELIITMLSEVSTRNIVIKKDAQGFSKNKEAAKEGGAVAREAREAYEKRVGEPVSSSTNYMEIPEAEQRKRLKKS